MPARLKSFQLHGYKTFATNSEFVFADGVTAIVGPNGSGKSNIADAIRWVLGEQSYSLLRAKKTEDMIFSGSELRPRAGMASATIIFDNSDGWLPIDYSEVSITHRAYRDGENEYLLNSQRVRLKDISELLAQSGLAERTYTVIGQGLVDAALSLKADERRRLFEEAAGIGLYRSRREEALRRLDSTQRNLERVEDILVELQPRLRSLERQAKRVQEYEQVKADLRSVLREWYGYHWQLAQSDLEEAQQASQKQEVSLEIVRQDQTVMDVRLDEFRNQIQGLREELSKWHRSLAELHTRHESLVREGAVSAERIRSQTEQRVEIQKELQQLEEEYGLYNERKMEAEVNLTQLLAQNEEARTHLAEATQIFENFQQERTAAEKEVQSTRQELADLSARQTILQEQLKAKQQQITQKGGTLELAFRSINTMQGELKAAEQRATLTKENLAGAKKDHATAETKLRSLQERISSAENRRKQQLEKQGQLLAELSKVNTQIEVLQQADATLNGYAEGAQLLLQAMRQSDLVGALGALGSNIDVPVELEKAIASALGEYVDAMVLEGDSGVDKALDLLSKDDVRGSLLSLTSLIPPKLLKVELDKAPGGREAVLGVASNLIKVPEHLRPVVELLLGQVLVVRDRLSARRILSSGDWKDWPGLRIVTVSGEVFHANGPILSGSMGRGVIVRPRQRHELEINREKIQQEISNLESEISQHQKDLDNLKLDEKDLTQRVGQTSAVEHNLELDLGKEELELEKSRRTLAWQLEKDRFIDADIEAEKEQVYKIAEELDLLVGKLDLARTSLKEKNRALESMMNDEPQIQLSYWTAHTAGVERAVKEAQNLALERGGHLKRLEHSQELLNSRLENVISELKNLANMTQNLSIEEKTIDEEIACLNQVIEPAEEEIGKVELAQNQWLMKDNETRQALSFAEHQYAQARISLVRRQEAFDALRHRIEDDFGLVSFDYAETVSGPKPLPLGELVEDLPKVVAISPDLGDIVQRQRAQLRRMGGINPEAQVEYQQVKERYEFLTEQMDDLHKAEVNIKDVIAELDLLMERELRKTFDAVAVEFRQIFIRLFGGGSARLVLTDPEDMTYTGIDIEARLPGRREQGLALLSGGERSLTATALVFALLRISPTPFCVLDEVDAMLDEANVGRFREMLIELSEKTQFIVVTHNRNTVQAASVIYGVTMGRDSSSQVISLRLDDVNEEYGV